eukprot:3291882-Prymnesium_polylepis.1
MEDDAIREHTASSERAWPQPDIGTCACSVTCVTAGFGRVPGAAPPASCRANVGFAWGAHGALHSVSLRAGRQLG